MVVSQCKQLGQIQIMQTPDWEQSILWLRSICGVELTITYKGKGWFEQVNQHQNAMNINTVTLIIIMNCVELFYTGDKGNTKYKQLSPVTLEMLIKLMASIF